MSTFTSRLQLEKPATSDLMSTGASLLSANYVKVDTVAGMPLVTSATRPATPFTGQLIRESDTLDSRFWNGTKWAYLGNEVNQRELISSSTTTTDITTSAETIFRSTTFTAENSRRYRIDFATYGELATNDTGRFSCNIRWANGATVATTDTLLYSTVIRCNSVGVTGKSVRDFCELNYTGVTGTITIGWFIQSTDAFSVRVGIDTDTIDVDSSFVIRDWGD